MHEMVSALPGSEQALHSVCTPSSSSSSRRRHVLVTQGVLAGPSATSGGGVCRKEGVHKSHQALLGFFTWFSEHLEQWCHLLTALHVQALLSPWFYHPQKSTTGSKPLAEHFHQRTGRAVQQNPKDGAWILFPMKFHSGLEGESKKQEIQLLSLGDCSADSRAGSNLCYAINQRMQRDSVIEVKSKFSPQSQGKGTGLWPKVCSVLTSE